MKIIAAEEIRALVSMPAMIEALADAFRVDAVTPARQIAPIPGGRDRLFVSMPAFDAEGHAVVKLVTLFPENAAKGLPNIQALIVLFSAQTGAPLVVLDGTVVTCLRTAAASALASRYLSREESKHLLIMGTGALAPYMALGHCSVRPITRVSVWGRSHEKAVATAAAIRTVIQNRRVDVEAPAAIEETLATADIVCCATSSPTPILVGRWLRPGTFVDLVGSFSPSTREADDETILRSSVFVDTYAGTLAEAGDILQPLNQHLISKDHLKGELSELVRGAPGRRSADEIIVFKSVGTAIEDLAAAKLIAALAEARCRKPETSPETTAFPADQPPSA